MQAALHGAVLTNRYSFNETAGTTAVDSISGKDGTLMNTAAFTGGGAVYLDSYRVGSSNATGAYIALPENVVTGLTAVTIETWYTPTHNPDANADWNRIWDFFNSSSHFFLRSGNATYGVRGGYHHASVSQGLDGPTVPDSMESHVMWTSDPVTGRARIYVNGTEVASTTASPTLPRQSVALPIGLAVPSMRRILTSPAGLMSSGFIPERLPRWRLLRATRPGRRIRAPIMAR